MAPAGSTSKVGKVIRPSRMPPPARTTPSRHPAPANSPPVAKQEPGSAADKTGTEKPANPPTAVSGWIVQAASFSSLESAQKLAGQLRQAGFSVSLSPHEVGKTTYYRVRVGPYPSEARARSAAPGVARISNTKVLIRSPGDG